MRHNFDEVVNRKNTLSSKWDNVGPRVGNAQALPMWVADTDFKCPQPIIDAIMHRASLGHYGYPYLPQEFKDVTKAWTKKRYNWEIDSEDVIFSASLIPAIFGAVQAFTKPGEKVLIQRPVYYPFSNAIKENGRIINNNPLQLKNGKYEIDFEHLEACAADPDTHLMILCNPHNPVSRVYTKEELRRIGYICLKHRVTIFSDEIHADFIYPGHQHIPIASISEEIAGITITAMAPSKTFNIAGVRSACLIIKNKELKSKMEDVFNRNRSAMLSTFGIDAYIAAFTHGEPYAQQLVEYLVDSVSYLDEFLQKHMPRIKLIRPQGTYLMWLDCRDLGLSLDELDDFFTNQSLVALDKGHWFGPEGNGFMRMNIACPRSTLKTALQQILEQYQKNFS